MTAGTVVSGCRRTPPVVGTDDLVALSAGLGFNTLEPITGRVSSYIDSRKLAEEEESFQMAEALHNDLTAQVTTQNQARQGVLGR